MNTWLARCAAVAVAWFVWSSLVYGQIPVVSPRGAPAPEFPQDPAHWINSAPLSLNDVKGKAVILWYFSEQCPHCRARWPEMNGMAKLCEGLPVLFIAVNSGASKEVLDKYAHEAKVAWPILVDTSRSYELQSGIQPMISLQNITQVNVITPDGQMRRADWRDLRAVVDEARKGATWKVDPNDVPIKLVSAWEGVEFGNYRVAGPLLTDALKSSDPEMKRAAEKLVAAVRPAIDSQIAEAKKAEDKGDVLAAYTLYVGLSKKFSGFELPADAAESKNKLAQDPKVKAGIAAEHELDQARKLLTSPNPVVKQRVAPMLQKIVKDSPDSSAGKEAQRLLGGGR